MRSESTRGLRWIMAFVGLLSCAALVQAQGAKVVGIYPPSSIERPADVGVRMHTNYIFYAPSGKLAPATQPAGEKWSGTRNRPIGARFGPADKCRCSRSWLKRLDRLASKIGDH